MGQSTEPASSIRQVRACCRLLVRTTPDLVARVSLTLALGEAAGKAREVLRPGERLAEEYGLRCWGQLEDGAVNLCFA